METTHSEWLASDRKALLAKLQAMRKAIGTFTRDRRNPHFGNTFVSLNSVLDAIQPVLDENNVLVIQEPLLRLDGQVEVTTVLLDLDTGYEYKTSMNAEPKNRTPQGVSDANTYLSRVSLLNLFKLPQLDTDGNLSSGLSETPDKLKPARTPFGNRNESPETKVSDEKKKQTETATNIIPLKPAVGDNNPVPAPEPQEAAPQTVQAPVRKPRF